VEDTGLVANIHPWETGIDNSPKWDQILEEIKVEKSQTQLLKRKDLQFVSAEERPSDEAYVKFVYLMELFKRCRYDQGEIAKQSPFLVYSVLFNSVLFRANLDLLKIASLLGKDSKEIQSWIERSKYGFEERLWEDRDGTYHSYNLRRQQLIRVQTASSSLPLYGSVPDQDRAARIKEHLYTVCPFHQEHLCVAIPTYDRTQVGFQASNYWRGPIWVNINWMICKGLLDYGFKELAGKIRLNILRLVEQLGFWEYFYPLDSRGLGSERFSWTAALVIDLLHEQTDHDPANQASTKK
jgi:glycogen debranching enzyme